MTDKINSIKGQSILFSTSDINVTLDSLKSEKSCGVDGLAAEHFMFAHRITHLAYLIINAFIIHCYLPADFMRTAIVPIHVIKNETEDNSDKNKYRPIALVIATSKLFGICIADVLETHLLTHDYQFFFLER